MDAHMREIRRLASALKAGTTDEVLFKLKSRVQIASERAREKMRAHKARWHEDRVSHGVCTEFADAMAELVRLQSVLITALIARYDIGLLSCRGAAEKLRENMEA